MSAFEVLVILPLLLRFGSCLPPLVYLTPNTRVQNPQHFPCPWPNYALDKNSNGGYRDNDLNFDGRPVCANGSYHDAIGTLCPYEGADACACPAGLLCCYPEEGPDETKDRYCYERKKVYHDEKVVVGCLQRIVEQSDASNDAFTLKEGSLCYYMRKENKEYKHEQPCGPGLHCCYSESESSKYPGYGYAWNCQRGADPTPFSLPPKAEDAYNHMVFTTSSTPFDVVSPEITTTESNIDVRLFTGMIKTTTTTQRPVTSILNIITTSTPNTISISNTTPKSVITDTNIASTTTATDTSVASTTKRNIFSTTPSATTSISAPNIPISTSESFRSAATTTSTSVSSTQPHTTDHIHIQSAKTPTYISTTPALELATITSTTIDVLSSTTTTGAISAPISTTTLDSYTTFSVTSPTPSTTTTAADFEPFENSTQGVTIDEYKLTTTTGVITTHISTTTLDSDTTFSVSSPTPSTTTTAPDFEPYENSTQGVAIDEDKLTTTELSETTTTTPLLSVSFPPPSTSITSTISAAENTSSIVPVPPIIPDSTSSITTTTVPLTTTSGTATTSAKIRTSSPTTTATTRLSTAILSSSSSQPRTTSSTTESPGSVITISEVGSVAMTTIPSSTMPAEVTTSQVAPLSSSTVMSTAKLITSTSTPHNIETYTSGVITLDSLSPSSTAPVAFSSSTTATTTATEQVGVIFPPKVTFTPTTMNKEDEEQNPKSGNSWSMMKLASNIIGAADKADCDEKAQKKTIIEDGSPASSREQRTNKPHTTSTTPRPGIRAERFRFSGPIFRNAGKIAFDVLKTETEENCAEEDEHVPTIEQSSTEFKLGPETRMPPQAVAMLRQSSYVIQEFGKVQAVKGKKCSK